MRRSAFSVSSLILFLFGVLIFQTAVFAAEASGSDVENLRVITGKAYENEYTEEDYTTLLDFEYAAAFLTDEEAAKYPDLSKSLEEYNSMRKDKIMSDFEAWRPEALVMYEDMPEYFNGFFEKYDLLLARADSRVLSFFEPVSMYTGGAHGSYGREGWNYDTASGKLLTLSDISPDPAKLLKRVRDLVKEKYPDLSFMDDNFFTVEHEADYSYVLTNEGLDFYIGPYMLASYAEGAQNVFVPYKGNEDLFNEKYTIAPECYTQALPLNENVLLDLDNDGDMETVNIYPEQDEYYNYRQIHVYIDEQDYPVECYCFGITPLFVHGRDGNYLYVEQTLENDYRKLYLYSIGADGVEEITDLECGFMSVIGVSDGYSCREMITDPDSFQLESRTDALSTSSISRKYHIGEGGIPVPDEEMWTIKTGRELTVLKEFSVDIIDEDGNVLEEGVTIAPGEKVTTFRTDDQEKIDVRTSDGRIARIKIDLTSWPMKIEGTDANEIFDGMMYAG